MKKGDYIKVKSEEDLIEAGAFLDDYLGFIEEMEPTINNIGTIVSIEESEEVVELEFEDIPGTFFYRYEWLEL